MTMAFAANPTALPARCTSLHAPLGAVSTRPASGLHTKSTRTCGPSSRSFVLAPVAPSQRRQCFEAARLQSGGPVRCEAADAGSSTAAGEGEADWQALRKLVDQGDFAALSAKLTAMKEAGVLKRYGAYPRQTFRSGIGLRDLKMLGIQNPEKLAGGSSAREERDATFAYIAIISVLGVALTYLPGDFGYFVPYLLGGSVLVLLGVGSTSPALLRAPIELFARQNPAYRRRIARHEAGHFLAGYALGLPVKSYTTEAAVTAVQFADEAVSEAVARRGRLDRERADQCTVVAMGGIAGEGLEFDEARGGQADLAELRSILQGVSPVIPRKEQAERTRWGVWAAAALLKNNAPALDALTESVLRGDSVVDCIRAIEEAPAKHA